MYVRQNPDAYTAHPMENTNLSVAAYLPILDISYVWNHTLCDLVTVFT